MATPKIQKSMPQTKKEKKISREEIARLAFELYEKDGREEGKDLEHWFEAERILRSHQ
ncbi:MAG: DUF2934 domain-containing protein [Candidatus Omnitrophica bacterium]|nr:DUF2934 domain-containing protein [Candidatus Omnitrophota bacterium]